VSARIEGDGEALRRQIRHLCADRRDAESASFFEAIAASAHRRVLGLARRTGALTDAEAEEIVGEVLHQLMRGALAGFKGETVPELLAFLRTVTDRVTWRALRRSRRATAVAAMVADEPERVFGHLPAPDRGAERHHHTPLAVSDRAYLEALLDAGSKAEHARRSGVSRAAVTQRVQRIQDRVAALADGERARHEAWLVQAAHEAVCRADEPAGAIDA
jgi:hypothetical protein